MSVRPVPEGTRLVHIGPPKTGTTSLQASFHASREALLAQGVRYAGRAQHSRRAVYAALRRPARPHHGSPPPESLWRALVTEIREAREPRVVLSSEILTDGDRALVNRVVDDLERDRIHVVATLRPLVRILPSQWQQAIKGGLRLSFEDWLQEVLDGKGPRARLFWHRHRHDRVVERWATAVGVERVSVVVVDDRDHGMVLRSFEQLLALRPGTLIPAARTMNRSMTMPEVEALRSINIASNRRLLNASARFWIRRGTMKALRSAEPSAGEARIELPDWAADRTREITDEIVAGLIASGVTIVGDPELLRAPGFTGQAQRDGHSPRASSSLVGALADVATVVARRRLASVRRGGANQRR